MLAETKKPVRLFVGNLEYGVSEAELHALFTGVSVVVSAEIAVDHRSGKSLGRG